jgi:hypothetical protein
VSCACVCVYVFMCACEYAGHVCMHSRFPNVTLAMFRLSHMCACIHRYIRGMCTRLFSEYDFGYIFLVSIYVRTLEACVLAYLPNMICCLRFVGIMCACVCKHAHIRGMCTRVFGVYV